MEHNVAESVKQYGGRHPITCILIRELEKGKHGDVLTSDDLKRISGLDCSPNNKGNSYLHSAIRYCYNSGTCVWKWIRGENHIKCLNDSEIVETSVDSISHIRRSASRAKKVMHNVRLGELSPDDSKKYVTNMAQLSTIKLFSSKKAHENILQSGKTELPKIEDLTNLFK